jgi:hypothetical protein
MCEGWSFRPSELLVEPADATLLDTRLCPVDPQQNGRPQAH